MKESAHPYADLLDRERPVSPVHPRMPMAQRAAQFAPFAALTGYEALVEETARLTQPRRELEENEKERLDRRLRWLRDHLAERPPVRVLYFIPDGKKQGGAYEAVSGQVLGFGALDRVLLLSGGQRVPVEEIFALEGEAFSPWE